MELRVLGLEEDPSDVTEQEATGRAVPMGNPGIEPSNYQGGQGHVRIILFVIGEPLDQKRPSSNAELYGHLGAHGEVGA